MKFTYFATLVVVLTAVQGHAQVPLLNLPLPQDESYAPPQVLGKAEAAPSPPQFWIGADYLLWWTDNGNPFQNSPFNGNPASGFRIEGGFRPGNGNLGIGAGIMHLENRATYRFGR